MKKILYSPIPVLAYLLYRENWSADAAYLVLLGAVLGATIILLMRRW